MKAPIIVGLLVSVCHGEPPPLPGGSDAVLFSACVGGLFEGEESITGQEPPPAFYARGEAACLRLARQTNPELAGHPDQAARLEFACGWAVGAIYKEHGLQAEVIAQPMSPRVVRAMQECVAHTTTMLARQAIDGGR